jgi:hypothetical protein
MHCVVHPQIEALWDCSRCEALHCDACVRRVGSDRRWLSACAHCDGVLRPLRVERVPEVREQLADLLRRPLSVPGLTAAGAVATFAALSDVPWPILDLAMGSIALVALSGTHFNALDHVARGKPGFPAPVEEEGWSPRTQATRGSICLLVVATPFGLWLAANRGAESVGELVRARPGTGLLLGGVALAWLTAALLAVLASISGLGAFWPPALVAVVARAPGLYLRLLALMAVTTLAAWMVAALGAWLTGSTPYLSRFVAAGLASVVLFAQATLAGGFVFRHREVYPVR